MAVMLPRVRNRDARRMELLYELGAFTYSAVLGVFAAMTVWYQLPATAQ